MEEQVLFTLSLLEGTIALRSTVEEMPVYFDMPSY
jgi:hypothetical protein